MRLRLQYPYRERLVQAVWTLLFIASVLLFLVEPNGFGRWLVLRSQEARLAEQRDTLAAENQALASRIEGLKSDSELIDTIARRDLGMARPEEITVRVIPPESAPAR